MPANAFLRQQWQHQHIQPLPITALVEAHRRQRYYTHRKRGVRSQRHTIVNDSKLSVLYTYTTHTGTLLIVDQVKCKL